jgi:hypothetical protein
LASAAASYYRLRTDRLLVRHAGTGADTPGPATAPACLDVDADGLPDDGDETAMRPLLNATTVPDDYQAPPLILLKVAGTDHFASGLYDHQQKKLEAISIFLVYFFR